MKRLTIVIFCLSMFAAGAVAQENEKAIEKLLLDQVVAWNAGDVEGYMKGYWNSDSTVFVSGGNLTRGYKGVLARYKKSYDTREKMGRLEFSELEVKMVTPAFGVATGVWRLYRAKDEPWGRFTLLVELKPEGWRIIHDHTSSAN
jgi:ketosteroid isomerase-like protein